jgi:hypothetical protein
MFVYVDVFILSCALFVFYVCVPDAAASSLKQKTPHIANAECADCRVRSARTFYDRETSKIHLEEVTDHTAKCDVMQVFASPLPAGQHHVTRQPSSSKRMSLNSLAIYIKIK